MANLTLKEFRSATLGLPDSTPIKLEVRVATTSGTPLLPGFSVVGTILQKSVESIVATISSVVAE